MLIRRCLWALLLSSCRLDPEAPGLPARPPPPAAAAASGAASVAWWPERGAGHVGPVVQARVALPAGSPPVAPASVALVRGELSEAAMRGLREGELPASARQRAVVVQVVGEEGALVVAPSSALEPGQAYTLAVGSLDLRATVVVDEVEWPVLGRLWPPVGEASAGRQAVFCGAGALAAGLVAGGFGSAQVSPGALEAPAPGCVTLAPGGERRPWVLPAALLGAGDEVAALLAPGPLVVGEREAPAALACEAGEAAFAPGCVRVLDDRALWRLPTGPWLRLDGEPVVLEATAVLRGLSPSSSELLEATVVDLLGQRHSPRLAVTTRAPLPHVVINEVLADALGPEPASEWVELVNDGATAIDLAGWSLDDVGGSTALPAVTLPPGAHALLASEGLETSADVAPAAGCRLLSVPKLGRGGLSNQGEALALRDGAGEVVSRWPAAPRPRAGISLARRRPDAPDDDPASFAPAAGGRPTPCAGNGP